MKSVILVFLGGGTGSALRYSIGLLLAPHVKTTHFPWATFLVNSIGSLIMGILLALLLKEVASKESHLFLAVGFCGGFTTFSSFTNEIVMLLKEEQLILGTVYLLISLIIGIGALLIGYTLTKNILALS